MRCSIGISTLVYPTDRLDFSAPGFRFAYQARREVGGMDKLCDYGSGRPVRKERCVKCGATCCAFGLRSATFCPRCAEFTLDTEGLSLGLSRP